jgi:hypothetical protein
MKKIYLTLIIILSVFQCTYAQWAVSSTNVNDINNTNSGNVIVKGTAWTMGTATSGALQVVGGIGIGGPSYFASGLTVGGTSSTSGPNFAIGQSLLANNPNTAATSGIFGLYLTVNTFPGSYTTTQVDMLSLAAINKGAGHTISYATGINLASTGAGTNNTNILIGGNNITGNYSIYNAATYQNYFAGSLGIGTISPLSKLDINGGLAIGSYAGANAAPTNGLIASGNVGIGTATPAFKLDVQGGNAGIYNTGAPTQLAIGSSAPGKTYLALNTSADAGGYGLIQTVSASGSAYGNTVINPNSGNVLIGQLTQGNSAYMLDVNGTARAKAIIVNTTGADFVFDHSYHLSSLSSLKKYIDRNHHLPEITSAKEMQANGLNVGDNQIKLLQKVEELTLYLIDKDNALKQEQDKNNQQETQLKSQQAQIDQLKQQLNALVKSLNQK